MAGVSADGESSLDEDVSEVSLRDVCHLSSVVSCGPADQCPVVFASTAVDQVIKALHEDLEARHLMLNLSGILFLVLQYDFRFLALFSCFPFSFLLFFV